MDSVYIHFYIHTHVNHEAWAFTGFTVYITLYAFRIKSKLPSVACKGLRGPAPSHFSSLISPKATSPEAPAKLKYLQFFLLRPLPGMSTWLIPPPHLHLSSVFLPQGVSPRQRHIPLWASLKPSSQGTAVTCSLSAPSGSTSPPEARREIISVTGISHDPAQSRAPCKHSRSIF